MSHHQPPPAPRSSRTGAAYGGSGGSPNRLMPMIALVIGILLAAIFPYALFVNAAMAFNGYQAVHNDVGESGEVTITQSLDSQSGSGNRTHDCSGDFRGEDGSELESIPIELPGTCVNGETVEVRVVQGYPGFSGYDVPRAWADGATGWIDYALLALLFTVLSLLGVGLILTVVRIVRAKRRPAATGGPPPATGFRG